MSLDRQVLLAGMLWLFTVVMKACEEPRLPDPGNGRIAVTDFFFRCLLKAALSASSLGNAAYMAKCGRKPGKRPCFPYRNLSDTSSLHNSLDQWKFSCSQFKFSVFIQQFSYEANTNLWKNIQFTYFWKQLQLFKI